MLRRLVLLIALVLVVAAPAAGQSPGDKQKRIEDKIGRLRDRIAEANRKEGVLTSQITTVTSRIRGLQDDVDSAQARVADLERDLIVYRNRLARLTQVLEFQTERVELLSRQNAEAQRQLERRVIEIYQRGDLDTMTLVLASASVSELIDGIDYANEINRQDTRIARQFSTAKREWSAARARTDDLHREVADVTAVVERRTDEQRAVRDRLVRSQDALRDARREKRRTLAGIQTDEQEYLDEVAGLEKSSASLAAQIRSAQGGSSGGATTASVSRSPSASGFIWPVSGPVTSGFGWRWGRLHEGIDIAVPTGTPVAAAAAGTVIYSGWMGGYGNLVVIDHGGGLSTAYGHNSSLASGVGQPVAQGQVIAYSGSTGHSTGPHVHFEVRVGGSPVDPLGYL
jgi:murein DD-endopeptidase MepM/ murein hydrolase activator NlpD